MWRYRIHSGYIKVRWVCGRPFRIIELALWDWCHYTHGSGKHIGTPKEGRWHYAWRTSKYGD